MLTTSPKKLSRENYTVGWLCALPASELSAANDMLDEEHNPPGGLPSDDSNTYIYGSINGHHVVIACLPPGMPGKVSAAKLVQPLARSFPNMRIHLFVGIGGGIPRLSPPDDPLKDIHLGDVVVGWADRTGSPGVVQYDFRSDEEGSEGNLLGSLDKPDRRLIGALGVLLMRERRGRTRFAGHVSRTEVSHPGLENDNLYNGNYTHERNAPTCSKCDLSHLSNRPARQSTYPAVHQGTILSGDMVIKNAKTRDALAARFYDAICVEMEAAGVMDETRCLVIRGISDYADSHKNGSWQPYAAATAAAFAREFLYTLEPRVVESIAEITSR